MRRLSGYRIFLSIFMVLLLGLYQNVNAGESAPSAPDQAAVAKAAADQAAVAKAATAGTPNVTTKWEPPSTWMLYLVPVIVFFGALISINAVKRALPENWSIGDALSEEVFLKPVMKTTTTKGVAGAGDVTVIEPALDKEGKAILEAEMRASSSRVIALMGTIVIMLMYIGFGTFALYSFGVSGQLTDEIKGVISYLLAGMTLFAPYVVNKFASLFQGLTGSK